MKTELIIVEGLPGSGKSTVSKMIADALNGCGVKTLWFDEGGEHPADYADYDFPDFETERVKILDKWRSFVKNREKGAVYVFNCVLIQNPITETMMRFGMEEKDTQDYINQIAQIIKPLSPAIVYIDVNNVKATLDSVLAERGESWLDAVVGYHTNQGYGKTNGLCGYDGYIKCLEERKKREEKILDSVNMKTVRIKPSIKACEISEVIKEIYDKLSS